MIKAFSLPGFEEYSDELSSDSEDDCDDDNDSLFLSGMRSKKTLVRSVNIYVALHIRFN